MVTFTLWFNTAHKDVKQRTSQKSNAKVMKI
jgi:hypothetical protein